MESLLALFDRKVIARIICMSLTVSFHKNDATTGQQLRIKTENFVIFI